MARRPPKEYANRPGPSPVVATAFAARLIRPRDRVLDVGCGIGTDTIGLAQWGVRDVTGVDVDAHAIHLARKAAIDAGEHVEERTRWRVLDVRALSRAFPEESFDVVVDTLVMNNLPEEDYPRYAYQVARVLKPRGRLIATWRVDDDATDLPPPVLDLPELKPHFTVGPIVGTRVPEHPATRRRPHHADVAVFVGRKRRTARPDTRSEA